MNTGIFAQRGFLLRESFLSLQIEWFVKNFAKI